MSAWKGALAAGLGLIAEEVLVTNAGGTLLITGTAGVIVNVIDHFGDPGVPAIPDLTSKSKPVQQQQGGNGASGGAGQTGAGQTGSGNTTPHPK